MPGFDSSAFAITLIVLLILAFPLIRIRRMRVSKRAREKIYGGAWAAADDFVSTEPEVDIPGCYIFLVFDRPIDQVEDFEDHKEVYVGRGEKAYESACERLAEIEAQKKEEGPSDEPRYTYVQLRPYDLEVLPIREDSILKVFKLRGNWVKEDAQ